MSLTPEEWRQGQELHAAVLRLQDANRAGHDYKDLARAYARWASWALGHAPDLLAASRPKCERCLGTGCAQPLSSANPQYRQCTDCNGTGWAQ